jgi:dTMP kinase
MRGRFITFEGGEGTGKSTQAALLAERLENWGYHPIITREPGGSPGAEIVRHVLLSGAAKPLGADTEAILFAAARDDHLSQTIRPALESGRWVICDRFADSTRVYQGVLGNVDPRLIRALERVVVRDTTPDLTMILDMPAQAGLSRASRRRGAITPDRYEAEAVEFHEELRASYHELARREPDRCVLIDASGSREDVAEMVWQTVVDRLQPRKRVRIMSEEYSS